GVDSSFLRL
uniref:Extended FMRFamide-4 n=11 Tax=Mantophasmatodea TaxID=192413 RepID=FAR4_AUSGA|nr:RecName: Full=Extended FMRFamide-4; Short=FMRFa-4 [Namaquaphasma ookiepense]B0M3A7.1 RecName: Full=Extended FMRFamide-4; Short=FMRFa-4 [Striatophasma naukluftense]B0M3C9.1 RecName: Full=Extended FMRFamide-4; Short=FMRFa-4 [Mantophasma kudubergense]B0M8U3.1 RecName: Full=Extended FMRFamide-4; Short=FMRFa-4 [Karoophasma botterkloofense]B3A065.1 RecName: Full=Extended FMRFamide-4; Short=FMRFa-4 [Karoophasma biedouwense]B3A084.1 RecName: Full=Extended FMRFamide-4; Short=FMRFa-4 [Lobatophasma re